MTSNSVFIRSLQFIFAYSNNRRRQVVARREGFSTALPRQIEVVEERCLLSAVSGSACSINEEMTELLKTVGGNSKQYPVVPSDSGIRFMNPLTSIPRLNSLPGAPVSIYLDFDGHAETDPSWNGGATINTPVFDIDGDLTTFSDEELRRIEELWYRVSEDFSPFAINVTTIQPARISDFESVLVSIGGDGSWLGVNGVVGVAKLNGFSISSESNTVFAFSAVDTDIKHIANTISHESGHTFGLEHQSSFDANGNKTAEYRPGTVTVGPLMGQSDVSLRDIWDNGPSSLGANVIQDDLAVLTRAANQTFRYRTDDHGNTISTATTIPVGSAAITANGVIERNGDIDMFRVDTDSGPISFSVDGLNLSNLYNQPALNPGTNLDAVLQLFDASGSLIVQSAPTTSLSATLSATVSNGTYYVSVSGTTEFGNLGQYTLTGVVVPLPTVPLIPIMTGPAGASANLHPLFEWSTGGAAAVSYELEVDSLSANVPKFYTQNVVSTSHLAIISFPEGTYQARVRTVAANGTFSGWSNYINFTLDIPAPAVPQITRPIGAITDSFPSFGWTSGDDVTTSYSLWVNDITNLDAPVRVIYRTAYADTSYVHFAPLKDGTYRAWVRAFNAVGEYSAWSKAVTFTVDSPVPTVPKVTGPVALSTNETPRITWTTSDGAARYDLWVNNLTTGVAQYIRKTNISYTTPFFDTPSLPQGSYKVWVRAANGNEELSNWSDPYTFTVDIQRPGVPSITGPVGTVVDQTITTSNPTFTWTAAARAVKYDLWVNNLTTGQAQIIRQQNITGLSYVALNNLPQGDYRAWVRGINSADEVGEWSTVFIFNLDEPTPTLPTIVEPKSNPAGSVENPNPTFVWTSEFNAPFYEFRLDDTTLNKTNVINVTNIQSKMYTIPNDKRLAEHIYNAYVRGVNNAGEKSDWSPAFRVRIDVPNPTTPTIIAPKLTSKDTTPTFEWTLDAGSFRYEILVRDLERDETIVLQVKSYLINQTDPTNKFAYYTLPDNQAFKTGTYRFWIRAFNSIGTASSWSTAQTFVISASLDLKDLKIVEPARLQSAEQFYADAVFYAEPFVESPYSMESDAGDANPEMMELASVIVPEHLDDMSAAMIENVMESLADPASVTSAMLSGVTFADDATSSSSGNTTTAAASILALAMIPKRRKRREE